MSRDQKIRLPIFRRIVIDDYGLYPNRRNKPGLDWTFSPGVTVVAGINGLGKTTLLKLMLYGFLGPRALTTEDLQTLGASARYELSTESSSKLFAERVPDGAKSASILIEVSIGSKTVAITRSLKNLKIESLRIGKKIIRFPTEGQYLRKIAKIVGISDAYELSVLLQTLMFFLEDRTQLLWLRKSQFEIFRILFLSTQEAKTVKVQNQKVLQQDSAYRNARAALRKQMKDFLNLEEGSRDDMLNALQKLKAVQKKFGAISDSRDELLKKRQTLMTELLEQEDRKLRQSIETSELQRQVQEAHDDYILSVLPQAHNLAQFVHYQIIDGQGCPVCGSKHESVRNRIEKAIADGKCPVCLSPPGEQEQPVKAISKETLDDLFQSLSQSRITQGAISSRIQEINSNLQKIEGDIQRLESELNLTQDERRAIENLPQNADEQLRILERLDEQQKYLDELKLEMQKRADRYRKTMSKARKSIDRLSASVRKYFKKYAEAFLAEDIDLEFGYESEQLGQESGYVDIPSFTVTMTSGASQEKMRRERWDMVSESQREFLDLAFRMALLDAIDANGATLFIETPEASLDSVFIKNGGNMLREFASHGNKVSKREVIATCNLVGNQMIPALLGLLEGQSRRTRAKDIPKHVINLLEIAAPTKALKKSGSTYRRLLKEATQPQ